METHPTSNGFETRRLVHEHVAALRRTQCFAGSRIVLVPEANLGNEAQEISEHLLQTSGLTVLCQRDDSYGVYTTPGLPQKFVFRVDNLFAHEGVSYHGEVVTANPFANGSTRKDAAAAAKKEFERQLRSFRRIHILPKSLNGRVSMTFTGKADKDNKKSRSLKDDMCMAFLFGVYWSGQHKGRLVKERAYTSRFVRGDGKTLAPTPDTGEDDDPDAAPSSRAGTKRKLAPNPAALDRFAKKAK